MAHSWNAPSVRLQNGLRRDKSGAEGCATDRPRPDTPYWNQPSMSITALTLPAALKRSTSPIRESVVSSWTTARLGRTTLALTLTSDERGGLLRDAGYSVR